MKIAVVYGSLAPLPPTRGIAPGIVIYNTIENFQALPEDNIVVFSHWEPDIDKLNYDHEKYHSVKILPWARMLITLIKKLPYRFYHPFLSRKFGHTDNEWLGYAISLLFAVRKYQPDLIVCHVNYKLPLLLSLFCPKAKIIYYHHGSNLHIHLSTENWRKLENCLSGLVSVSQAAIDGLEQKFGKITIYHKVIRNGVDTNLFSPTLKLSKRVEVRKSHQVLQNDFVFLYSGRIVSSKGIHHLISVFLRLVKDYSFIHLWIAGSAAKENRADYQYERRLKEMAESHPNNIKFLGWFPNQQMPVIFASADATVLPATIEEGIPLSLLESMACGTPVIASKIGGIPEIITNHETGILIDPENIETSLEAAMKYFLTNPELIRIYSKSGVENTQSNYTYHQVAHEFFELINDFRKDICR